MIVVTAQAFPPQPGGIQYLLAGTAEHIAKAGYEVTVLADGTNEAALWDSKANAPYLTERFGGFRPLRRWRKARRIHQLCRQGRINALYADSWKSLEALNDSLPFPVVVWAHGNEYPDNLKKEKRIRSSLKKASHVIFNSDGTKMRAQKFIADEKACSIVNPPLLEPVKADHSDKIRAEAVWGDASPRLVSLCRLIDWKGIDTAIRAFAQLLKHHSHARYVVAGVGSDLARLQQIAIDSGVGHAVDFIGWCDGGFKTALLEAADLFVQPGRQVKSEREGYGISYAEAALHNLPSISGNVGGAPEAVLDGKSGLVVDGTNDKAVLDAMLSVVSDPQKHKKMREAARVHGQSCLWQNQIDRVLSAAGMRARG